MTLLYREKGWRTLQSGENANDLMGEDLPHPKDILGPKAVVSSIETMGRRIVLTRCFKCWPYVHIGFVRGRTGALCLINVTGTKRRLVIPQSVVCFARTVVCKKRCGSCSPFWVLPDLRGSVRESKKSSTVIYILQANMH